jgi:hypothetical protein
MATTVSTKRLASHGFFTVNSENISVRYFNGRKYVNHRNVTHFVHPSAHETNFSDYTSWVAVYAPGVRATRFTRTTVESKAVRPPF